MFREPTFSYGMRLRGIKIDSKGFDYACKTSKTY